MQITKEGLPKRIHLCAIAGAGWTNRVLPIFGATYEGCPKASDAQSESNRKGAMHVREREDTKKPAGRAAYARDSEHRSK